MINYDEIHKRYSDANQCVEKIREIRKVIYNNTSQNKDSTTELKQAYQLVKNIIPSLYIDGKMHPAYEFIRVAILDCEEVLQRKFIVNTSIEYDIHQEKKQLQFLDTPEMILQYIVSETRKILSIKHSLNPKRPLDINNLDLANDCQYSSNEVKKICDSLKIKCSIVTIHPGYDRSAQLFNGNGFHMFNIITLYNKKYIVDCTYQQFFTLKGNSLDRLGIAMIANCKPGTFMLMNESRKKTAEKLLTNGWIEFDEAHTKNYFDGFTLSFRNGLYYEKTDDFSYETHYSQEDYINFLLGKDNQVLHENEECLGFQKKTITKKQY